MDLLANLASDEVLRTEITNLRSTNLTLNEELVEARERCQRLEEEASMQLGFPRGKDETEEEFKNRKQTVYNKRSYRKQRGDTPEEENRRLISELETLRGQLILLEEKCDRLSEVGNLQLLDRLPDESDAHFAKRRAITYNSRSYQKRKKRMKLKKGTPEPRHPSSVASLPADNPTMQGLDMILNRYTKQHPKTWPSMFQKSQDIRLLNVSYWINESGLIKESNPKRASVTLSPPSKILPSSEIKRYFAVQFLDPNVNEWCDLFFIKPSTLVVPRGPRQNAGYGLFSARPFKCGDRIAVYIGEVFEFDELPANKRTCYSLAFDINETAAPLKKRRACRGNLYISDCGYPPKDSTDNMKRPPVYFGIHYVNDPKWQPDGIQEQKRASRGRILPPYNMQIGTDLVATTISDIEEGEELFWDYTAGTGSMHDM
jgi:hypothetical protein